MTRTASWLILAGLPVFTVVRGQRRRGSAGTADLAGQGAGRLRHVRPGESPCSIRFPDQGCAVDHERFQADDTVFRPAPEKNTGAAMVICPGGGYWNLAWDLEGTEVAAWLNSVGMTGVVLKYRVPRRPGQPERLPAPGPLLDAQRAISLVRSRANEWGIDPNRIGIVGFSAGGHLAVMTATNFDKRAYDRIDDIDSVGWSILRCRFIRATWCPETRTHSSPRLISGSLCQDTPDPTGSRQ